MPNKEALRKLLVSKIPPEKAKRIWARLAMAAPQPDFLVAKLEDLLEPYNFTARRFSDPKVSPIRLLPLPVAAQEIIGFLSTLAALGCSSPPLIAVSSLTPSQIQH